MRILVVDDDIVDRRTIKRTLQQGGGSYDLVEAETVDKAIAIYDQQDFDLVLVDYRLPGRDGVEMLLALREGRRSAIVMMSTVDDEQVALDSIRAGAQDFVLKHELNASRLRRAILQAQTRFDLEIQLHESHEKLKTLAERDALTGLANRYLFDESLKLAIANNRRDEFKLCLLLIDLDNFKHVNDNFGHDVGDMLLQAFVKRVHACLRGNELFARLGGDEFAITLTNLHDEKEASSVAQRILVALEAPFNIDGKLLNSTASIGIAMHSKNAPDQETLVKHADIAMYRAKKKGRHQACFYENDMQACFSSRYEAERDLRDAFKKEMFSLLYQPIYEARTHQLGCFEAFLHWQDERGVHETNSYLNLAEESKFILQLGRWAIETAIMQQVEWFRITRTQYAMHINLSPTQVAAKDLVEMLSGLFTKHGASPSNFVFELTELAFAGQKQQALEAVHAIRNMGCKVALDDFGTGASSISTLRDFSFDLIKIDPSFVPRENASQQDLDLFKSVVRLIQSMALKTVVVGTETIEHIELCCELDVDQLQGHFFLKPETADHIEKNIISRAV